MCPVIRAIVIWGEIQNGCGATSDLASNPESPRLMYMA
jgi:hypothetical protein